MSNAPQAGSKVVWSPLAGAQALAMSCPANILLFEGTRGPGKTDAQILKFRANVGKGYGRFWRGIIFDRAYKNLDDVISKSERWFSQFDDGARFLRSKSDYKWVWPTGEELLFRQFQDVKDYWNYHGQEFAYIGWNELCKFPDAKPFDMMMSCNRTSFLPAEHSPDPSNPLPPIPLQVFATTNPYGVGHNWVKHRFIDVAPPGKLVRTSTDVFNPQTQKRMTIEQTQVRLFGSYKENRFLDPLYVANLENIKEENRRRAWLLGDWNIVAGGAFDDLWKDTTHILPRFVVPKEWQIFRSFDWGSTKPFSVGWWCVTNGEEISIGRKRYTFPPKTLIRFAEWYGSEEIGSNEGLRIGSRAIAEGILEREHKLLNEGWIQRTPRPGPADSSIFDDGDADDDSIARKMEDAGVYWQRANKGPGSRKNGLQILRDRMEASTTGEGAGLYFTDNCKFAKALIPVLPRDEDDPDDVDTDAEDHLYDEMRYMALSGMFRGVTKINTKVSH